MKNLEDLTYKDYSKAWRYWRKSPRKRDSTFDRLTWIKIWQDSKVFHLRGSYTGSYRMERLDTALPWGINNYEIVKRTPGKNRPKL